MCEQRYRVQYLPGVDAQLAAAHDEFPTEIGFLRAFTESLGCGAMTVEELRECGKLVFSAEDQTDYLYQHANAGRVCLSLAIDEEGKLIEVRGVMRIIYMEYGPLQRGRMKKFGTRNS